MSDESKKVEGTDSETVDYGAFLTTSAEDIQTDDIQESNADPDYYRPSLAHKEAKEKRLYKGLGRFVLNVHNRDVQKISKYIFCLPTPGGDNNSKFYVDVPEGEGATKNIVTQAFFALREHESVTYQAIAKEHFSRKMYHWMLYLIMSDVQEPELEGKVKIFRFGKKINDKIEYEAKPDPSVKKTTEISVHDPFEGKDLMLHINEVNTDKGGKMTSYDQSKFEELSAISLDGGETRMTKSQDDMKKIFEFLKAESPDLTKAAHKPWTEDEEEKVIKSVRMLIDDDILFNQIYKKAYGKNFLSNPPAAGAAPAAQQKKVKKEDEVTQSNVEFEDDTKANEEIKDDTKTAADIQSEVIKDDTKTGDNSGGDAMEINVEFEE